jgi:hypothetical protein
VGLRAGYPSLCLDDVDGQPDRSRLVSQRPDHRLADPPCGVGRELDPPAIVEQLSRPHQADRPLLNQVKEGQTLAAIVLGDRHHEAEIRLDQPPLRLQIAAFDASRERALLVRPQQAMVPQLCQKRVKRIGQDIGR